MLFRSFGVPGNIFNAVEQGGTSINPVIDNILYYGKHIINYSGIDGVIMNYAGAYRPFDFYKSQYYSYSSAGTAVSSMVSSQDLSIIYAVGPFVDFRFNKGYLYSPASTKLVDFSSIVVSSSDGTASSILKPDLNKINITINTIEFYSSVEL
mgnify:CR=1 FL=1